SDRRVQLVDGAVCLDARAILGRTLAADEVRLAAVAAARVDAGDADRHGVLPIVAPSGCPPARSPHPLRPSEDQPKALSARLAWRLMSARSFLRSIGFL